MGSALGIAALTTVFFSSLGSTLHGKLTDAGVPAADATTLSNAVTDSAGAVIKGLAAQPETVFAADAAREAMTQALAFGSYLAAGFLVVGVIATLLIPSKPRAESAVEEPETVVAE